MKLDKIDIKILCELQKNGRISNVELAEVVHLSASRQFSPTCALTCASRWTRCWAGTLHHSL